MTGAVALLAARPVGPFRKRGTLMTRRSALVLVLAAIPLLGGLLIGCNSQGVVDPPQDNADRNERVRDSTDYMRQQYESKQQGR